MWNIKCFVIPVITGATGIVIKGLKILLETIPGKHSIVSLQKAAIPVTSHIIRKVLQSEIWSLSGGAHHWFKRRSTRGKETYFGWTKDRTRVARLEVFIAMKIQVAVFCVVTPCGDVAGYQRLAGPCCLHLLHPEHWAVWSSETLPSRHITTLCHNPEDRD